MNQLHKHMDDSHEETMSQVSEGALTQSGTTTPLTIQVTIQSNRHATTAFNISVISYK